jgi:hypothetical protein
MTIVANPQNIIVANQDFQVNLTSNVAIEQGELNVFVDGEQRGTPLKVTVLNGVESVTVEAGWGSIADKGRSLTVSAGTPSKAVIIC